LSQLRPQPDWYYGHYIGTIGVKPGTPSARWRFLRNEYYLAHAIGMLHPAAIIDTTTDALSGLFHSDRGVTASEKTDGKIGNRFRGLEKTRLAFDDAVLVMPHTHTIEAFLTSYSEWVAAGIPSTASESEDDSWLRPSAALTSTGSYDAAIDPLQRALPVPIEADFRVTGLMENAQWRDASHLEASRALLQARYDLKIGIWDLARNPILRQTLLDANPIDAAPDSATAMPSSARQRAEGHVNATLAKRATKREIWDSMLAGLQPLIQMGWDPIDKYGRHWHLRLPLTQTFFDGYYSNDGEPHSARRATFNLRQTQEHRSDRGPSRAPRRIRGLLPLKTRPLRGYRRTWALPDRREQVPRDMDRHCRLG